MSSGTTRNEGPDPPPRARDSKGSRQILIVDDHPIVRDGLKQLLAHAEDLVVAAEAGSADEALALLRRGHADLLVLDIGLPGRSGLDLLHDLHRTHPALPVVVLSIHSEDEFAVRAIRAGAAGYLQKDCPGEELLTAIRTILEGHKYISATVAEQLAEELQQENVSASHEQLSDRELEVLCLIASGKSAKEVASALGVGKSTVSTYRARILRKLKMQSNAEITRYALRRGLVT